MSAHATSNQTEGGDPDEQLAPNTVLNSFHLLWPLVVGLGFGRAGLIVASYGSYTSTDEGIFTDGAMLVALCVLAVFFVIITVGKVSI